MVIENRLSREYINFHKYWLSVCIPAYEHAEGVLKILDEIYRQRVAGIEVIIADDSLSDSVELVVKKHPAYQYMNIGYVRNSPPLGAVDNWNFLLEKSKGEYLMLMHHDEAPFTENFFKSLQQKTKDLKHVDVFVLDCFVKKGGHRFYFRHMPVGMKRWIFNFNPLYILRHNIFGPTAVFVFKKEIKCEFDPDLKWLVDVDWIFRLLSGVDISIKFLKDISIISETHSGAITNKIRSDIPMLTRSESRIIRRNIGGDSVVFRMLDPANFLERFLTSLDFFAWRVFRLTHISISTFRIFLKNMRPK